MGFTINLGGSAIGQNMSGKPKRRKFGVGTMIFFVLIGSVFATIGIFAINMTKIDGGWTRVAAEVVDIDTHTSDGDLMYAPICSYTVNGQDYTIKSNSSSNISPSLGGDCEVAYNPANPEEAKVDAGAMGMIVFWIFPVVGIVIILVGIISFVTSRKRAHTIDDLVKTGRKIAGILTGVNNTSSTNGVQNYKLVVSADDGTGAVREFTSDTVVGGAWVIATANFATNPVPIDVYLSSNDPNKYYVDISDVQNLTSEQIQQMAASANGPAPAVPPVTVVAPTLQAPTAAPVTPPQSGDDFDQDLQNLQNKF
jgi:hypothetical protein